MESDNCARYYRWNETDECCQLPSALHGQAGYFLWELGGSVNVGQVKRSLHPHHGNDNRVKRFRAEVRCWKQGPGGSFKWSYREGSRLMASAYPDDPASKTSMVVGRDAFLDALGNPELRASILESEPRDSEEILSRQLLLEAHTQPFVGEITKAKDIWATNGKYTRSIQGGTEAVDLDGQDQRFRTLEADGRKLTLELSQRLKASSATTGDNRDKAPDIGNSSQGRHQSLRRSTDFGRESGHRFCKRGNSSNVQPRTFSWDGISTSHLGVETGQESPECFRPGTAEIKEGDIQPTAIRGLGNLDKLGGVGEKEVYIQTIDPSEDDRSHESIKNVTTKISRIFSTGRR